MNWKWQDELAVCPGKLWNWWEYWPLSDKKEGNIHEQFQHSCYNYLYQSNRQDICCFAFRKSCLRSGKYLDLGVYEALRQTASNFPHYSSSPSPLTFIFYECCGGGGLKAFLEMKMMLEVETLPQNMRVFFLSFVNCSVNILVLLFTTLNYPLSIIVVHKCRVQGEYNIVNNTQEEQRKVEPLLLVTC